MKCCICEKEIKGYENNALPYKNGKCCDKCNIKFVIPLRAEIILKGKKVNKNKMKGW